MLAAALMRHCLSMPAHHPWLSPDHSVAAQAAFHVFGMELLAELDLDTTNQFFTAFFRLPAPYWQGFLASRLSSARLIVFAAATFLVSPEQAALSISCLSSSTGLLHDGWVVLSLHVKLPA